MTTPTAAAKMVACPGCGASITLRALGQSVMVACPSCGSRIDVSRPDIALIKKYTLATQPLRIPLGTRGTLRKQIFEVIGAMGRSVSGGRWQEYLLFNPSIGFRWLVYDEGHWSLGQMLKDTATIRPDIGRPYQGHTFRTYDMDTAVVDWVVGEFYWRVAAGDSTRTIDYISPPWMLSNERSGMEVTWTLLEYIEPAEIEAAFHIKSPPRQSMGICQPNPARASLQSVRKLALWAVLAAFLIQIAFSMHARNSYTPLGEYDLHHTASDETQVYGPVDLTAGRSVNQIVATSQIDNAWVELQGSLVNTVTGQSFRFVDPISYYYGHDSDGYWSEGSRSASALISGVPAGSYNVVIDGTSGDSAGRALNATVSLQLAHDVVVWRNFWIAVGLILLYPLYLVLRSAHFEQQRWSDSDFSPFKPKGN